MNDIESNYLMRAVQDIDAEQRRIVATLRRLHNALNQPVSVERTLELALIALSDFEEDYDGA
jgi:hypothetical protein